MHGSLRTLYRSQENLGFRLRQTALTDIIAVMAGQAAAMHVARIRSGYTDKQGQRREYESRYLRRTYRDGGKVRHETLANLSGLPWQLSLFTARPAHSGDVSWITLFPAHGRR